MKLGIEDLYIDCDENIKIANELYLQAIQKDLSFDNREYLNSMNKYINTYKNFREIKIRQYIADLKYICEGQMNQEILYKIGFCIFAIWETYYTYWWFAIHKKNN